MKRLPTSVDDLAGLRAARWIRESTPGQLLFEDFMRSASDEFHTEWDNASEREKRSRTLFAQHTLKPLQVKMRDLELEIQSNLAKSQTTEQQLYSGKVRNPKELQDMQQEIAALKNWHGELENRLLEAMVAVEEAEARLADEQIQLEKVATLWESQHQDLLQEKDQLEKQLANLRAKHKAALAEVAPENLNVYNGLKPRKNNQPIAALQEGSCAVCGIEQTSTIEQEVRRGHQLVMCLGCGRILVHLNS